MGNHEVGRGMSAAARVFWLVNGDKPVTKELALAAINEAGNDYEGADAEFDDELSEVTDLSRLVAIAFDATPDELADLAGEYPCHEDDVGMLWHDGPYARFRKHFSFC